MVAAIDGAPIGTAALGDELRPHATATLARLRAERLEPVMRPANSRTARSVAASVRLEEVLADGNDNPIWPHRDGLSWPHPGGVVRCSWRPPSWSC